MSGTTEIPDILGHITNAVGLDRLWQTNQQADAEKRMSQRQEEERVAESTDEKARKIIHTAVEESRKNVAPVSFTTEPEKERAHVDVDHSTEGRGASEPQTPPDPSGQKANGYGRRLTSSLEKNQPALMHDGETTQDDKRPPSQTDDEQTAPDVKPSKISFVGALKPFMLQQTSSLPASDGTQSAPLHRANPFDTARPQSSSSHRKVYRQNLERQYTMPAPATSPGADNLEPTKRHSAAKSRWVAATHGLRFPLRRKKDDKKVSKTKGTEVVTTLVAGAPAAEILASHMVLDEHSHHRIPIIVDLLRVCRLRLWVER